MILVKEAALRNPFALVSIPWKLRIYKRLFNKVRTINETVKSRGFFRHGIPRHLFRLFWNYFPCSTPGRFILRDTNGQEHSLPINPKNSQFHALYLDRYLHGYEPEVSNFLDAIIQPSAVFYDIGANWGYFTFFLSARVDFCGYVYAFEPLKTAYGDLAELVRLTQALVTAKIVCLRLALSDEIGHGLMNIPDGIHSGSAELVKVSDSHHDSVSISRLDDLNYLPPNVVKIDAEGHEYRILVGGKQLIENSKPVIVFESFSNIEDPKETLAPFQLLEGLGYIFFHPAWLQDSFLRPDNRALFQSDTTTLALSQFTARERMLQKDKINCIACHQDELVRLKSIFKQID